MHQHKQFFFQNSLLTVGLLSSLSLGLLNTQPVQASSLELNFIGQSVFPTETFYQGTKVGGLSGITYNLDLNAYYIISDDRSQIHPARFYTATINPTQFNANGVRCGSFQVKLLSLAKSL